MPSKKTGKNIKGADIKQVAKKTKKLCAEPVMWQKK